MQAEVLSRKEKIDAIIRMIGIQPTDPIRAHFEDVSDTMIDRAYLDCLALAGYFIKYGEEQSEPVCPAQAS